MKTRRELLLDSYLGLGAIALADLFASSAQAATGGAPDPLAPKPQHHPAKAKRCIFLFM